MTQELPRIGPYRTLRVLGHGGMGLVYQAVHAATGAQVALKTVRVRRRSWLEAIRREIQALSRLRHPGVVRIVDHGVEGVVPWYAMELLRGNTLASLSREIWDSSPPVPDSPAERVGLERTVLSGTSDPGDEAARIRADDPASIAIRPAPPELNRLLDVALRLCRTLAYVHGEGIVHGDLKPANVIIGEADAPVLVDFGVMSNFRGADRETVQSTPHVSGTPSFMAPERIRGDLPDPRDDLFSLGVILYWLLTGREPFEGRADAVVGQILFKEVPPPSLRVSGIPEAIDRLVLGLLAKARHERIGFAEDVAAALVAVGANEPRGEAPRPRRYLNRPRYAGESLNRVLLARGGRLSAEPSGSLTLLGGPSGIGKTRLALELARSLQRPLTIVAEHHETPGAEGRFGPTSPLSGFQTLLQMVADTCAAGGPEVTRELLGDGGRALAVYQPLLLQLPGSERWPEEAALPPGPARQRLFAHLARAAAALARHQTLLFIIDDLQWADELTIGFVAWLPDEWLAAHQVHLVALFRDDPPDPRLRDVLARRSATQLHLGPLPPGALEALVGDMLSTANPPRALLDFLMRLSSGNPLHVTEYLRLAVEEGSLHRSPTGSWSLTARATSEQAEIPMPETLIRRRLDRLAPTARRVVEVAATIGREVDADLLGAASGLAEAAAGEAIADLVALGFVEETGRNRLRFLHDKLREVAFSTVAAPADLHRRVAEATEALYHDRPELERHAAALGHHYAAAGMSARAVVHLDRAAADARAAFANEAAARLYREAIAQAVRLEQRSDPAADPVRLAALQEALGDLLTLMSQRDEARQSYSAALERLEGALDRARLLRKTGKSLEVEQRPSEALARYAEARQALGPGSPAGGGWLDEWIQIHLDEAWIYYFSGRLPEMEANLSAIEPLVSAGSALQRARFHAGLTQIGLRRQRYRIDGQVVEQARLALREARAADDAAELVIHQFGYGLALMLHGRLEPAASELAEALRMAERLGDRAGQLRSLSYLALTARLGGQAEKARAWNDRALAMLESSRLPDYLGAATSHRAWLAGLGGDLPEARRLAVAALDEWSRLPMMYPFQWLARLPLARALLGGGDVGAAAEALRPLLDPRLLRLPDPAEGLLARALTELDAGASASAEAALKQALAELLDLGYV